MPRFWLIPLSESHLRSTLLKRGFLITILGAHTWHWVPAFRIRRPLILTIYNPIRTIAAENRIPFAPDQSLVGCTTNTSSRLLCA
jgi:hypothetical protein